MTTPHLDPRSMPVDCLYDAHWARRLKLNGYGNVGDVIDATPEALADRLYAVGPKRAAQLRQRALDYVSGFETARQHAEFYQVETSEILGEVYPSLGDAIVTIGSLLAIGALGTLTIWWLL